MSLWERLPQKRTVGTRGCLLLVETRDNLGFGYTDPFALGQLLAISGGASLFARKPTLQVGPELTLNFRNNGTQNRTVTGYHPQAVQSSPPVAVGGPSRWCTFSKLSTKEQSYRPWSFNEKQQT